MRAFLRSLGELAGGVLKRIMYWGPLVLFDLFDAWEKFVLPNTPDWAKGYLKVFPDPTPYLIVGVFVLAIGWTYHELRMRLPENLKFNMPIDDAVDYLREISSWGTQLGRSPRAGFIGALLELRQKSSSDNLIIEGREETDRHPDFAFFDERPKIFFANVWKRIPAIYWETHEIIIYGIYKKGDSINVPQTRPENINDPELKEKKLFANLRVAKPQIEALWPKRIFWKRIWKKIRIRHGAR